MDNTAKRNVGLRSTIVDAQSKKISAEIEIITLLAEMGNKKEAEALLTKVKKDINVLISQHWYESLLSDLETLVKSLR